MRWTCPRQMVKSVIAYVLETCPDEMAFFNQFFDKTLLERLNALVNSGFCPRFLHGGRGDPEQAQRFVPV